MRSTTPRTFELAGFLLSKGFDATDIYNELYRDDYCKVKLRAEYVLSVPVYKKRRGVYLHRPATPCIDEA